MTEFRKRLKEALDIRGMKAADLAKKTGIGKSSISTYLAGEYRAKQENVKKIADALNVDPDWLNGYDVPMESTPLERAKKAVDKYNLYIAALHSIGWDEQVVNQYGHEFSTQLDEDTDIENEWTSILTNGVISFEISKEDSNKFEDDLNQFITDRVQQLMVKASKSISPKR